MRIKVTQNFISAEGNGDVGEVLTVSDSFGQHLVDIGNAVSLEQLESAPAVKPPAVDPSSASQAAPVSTRPTAKPHRVRPPRSSQ
jgi:hypothetical protein